MKKQVPRRMGRGFILVSAFLAVTCGSDDYSTDTLTRGDVGQTRGPYVQLIWDPNTEPDLGGYWVYQSISSGRYTRWNRVLHIPADIETCTIDRLLPGTYFWVVTALDTSQNESGYSNEVSATID